MALPKNCVRDDNVDKKLKVRTFWARDLVQFATTSVVSGFSTLTAGFNTSTPVVLQQLGTTSMTALRFATAQGFNTSASIDFCHDLEDVDSNWPIYVRCEWTTDATAAATTRPIIYYSTLTDGQMPQRPATELTKQVATSTKAAGIRILETTGWGYIAPLATGVAAYEVLPSETTGINFKITFASLTAAAVASDFLYVTRVQVGYTSRETFGSGSTREARHMAFPLGNIEADPSSDF